MRACTLCMAAAIGLLPAIASAQDGLRSASLPERPLTSTGVPARDLYRAEPDAYTTLQKDRPAIYALPYPYALHVVYPFPYVFPYVFPYASPYVFPYVYPFPYVFPDGYWYLGSLVSPAPLRPSTGSGRPELVEGRGTRSTYVEDTETASAGRVPQSGPAAHAGRVTRSGPAETPAAAAPGAPKTFYVIAGCYAGDRPPRPARLPPDCDPSKVRVIPP